MANIPTLDEFKGQFSAGRGPALANLYYVELPFIQGSDLSANERNLLCRAARIPGRQLATYNREIGIEKQSIAYGYGVADVTLTFHVLNDYKVRKYFEAWQNLAVDQDNQQIKYADNYKFPTKIYQLAKGTNFQLLDKSFNLFNIFNINLDLEIGSNQKGNIAYGVELDKSFPITMNGIDLADASENQVVELSVDLSYKNWKRIA